MKIGYLRVSTKDQCADRQVDPLRPICDELYIERVSATARTRPVYEAVMLKLRPGDTFVILDLDRAFRSALEALDQLHKLHARGVEIHIHSMCVDTKTPFGKAMFTVVSALAEFERDVLSERTKQGLEAARARGVCLGRPLKLNPRQVVQARARLARGERVKAVARSYGIHPSTLRRNLDRAA